MLQTSTAAHWTFDANPISRLPLAESGIRLIWVAEECIYSCCRLLLSIHWHCNTTSTDVVTNLKSIFARHGIPEVFISDNGPQYSSSLFATFSREYKFNHITSSPRYPQANGEAERAVKAIKAMLDKCSDPYLGLLAYRTTPLENGYSPAELLMGRKLQSTLPVIKSLLMPKAPPFESLLQKEEKRRRKMKQNFD